MNFKTSFSTPKDVKFLSDAMFPAKRDIPQTHKAAKYLFQTVASILFIESPNNVVTIKDIIKKLNYYRETLSCHTKLEATVLKSPAVVGELYQRFLQSLNYVDEDTEVHISLRYDDIFIYLERMLKAYLTFVDMQNTN